MNKLLTIIVPTYDMEKYLDKCLSSLIIQDLGLMKQLEVLVVNDGSKDRSSEIAHSYESDYPETFRVIDKDNGNYGSCINRGLIEATGKYIKVLDADDWFNTNVFETYLKELMGIEVDLVITEFISEDDKGHILSASKYNLPLDNQFKVSDLPKGNWLEMHVVTYRTSVLRDIHYTQTEGISYTDTEWATIPLYHIRECKYYPLYLYHYLLGRDGQTTDLNSSFKRYTDYILTFTRILKYHSSIKVKELPVSEFIEEKIKKFISIPYYIVLYKFNGRNSKELYKFDCFLKNDHHELYEYLDDLYYSYGNVKVKYVHNWRTNRKGYSVLPFKYRIANKLSSLSQKLFGL